MARRGFYVFLPDDPLRQVVFVSGAELGNLYVEAEFDGWVYLPSNLIPSQRTLDAFYHRIATHAELLAVLPKGPLRDSAAVSDPSVE